MEKIIRKLESWYKTNIKHTREPPIKLIDPIFHHHKIKTYGNDLRNPELPLEDRATAASYIGMLSYTGGSNAAMVASAYIKDMIDILLMPDTSSEVRIAVLKGLCGMCYISYTNQNEAKESHLTEILLSYLEEDENISATDPEALIVKFWVCYLMTVVCCNNIPYIKLIKEVGGQTLRANLESLSKKNWKGWPENYAELMTALLGPEEKEKQSVITQS